MANIKILREGKDGNWTKVVEVDMKRNRWDKRVFKTVIYMNETWNQTCIVSVRVIPCFQIV